MNRETFFYLRSNDAKMMLLEAAICIVHPIPYYDKVIRLD